MPLDISGILQNFSLNNEQSTVLYPYLREVFINEAPLFARLDSWLAEAESYSIITYDVRPRLYTLSGAFTASTGSTTLTMTDTSPLLVGDVLEVLDTTGALTERIEVQSITNGTTAVVRRAVEGTAVIANTAGGAANTLVVTLIGNSRTGSEIDQVGNRAVRTLIPQSVQTYTYPVQVGGKANAVANTRLPAGISDVFTLEQKVKMTEMVRDIEYGFYFGKGDAPVAVGDRAKQRGLKALIGYYNGGSTMAANANANVNTSGGGSYTFLNFVSGPVQKAIDGGGDPDTVICSTNFVAGLQTWGFAKQQINQPKMNAIGLPVKEIAVPFTSGNLTFVPSYQLPAGTAIVLSSQDVKTRHIREAAWRQRANRGDAIEGEYFADMCIELGHPGWHSWVSGITSFA